MGDIDAHEFFLDKKIWKEYNASEKIMEEHLAVPKTWPLKFTDTQSFIKAGVDREKEFDYDVIDKSI